MFPPPDLWIFWCSRFYQLFNRTIALFRLTILNTPESIIPGRMTTKGRIEYHFLVFGGLAVLVIEVKYVLGVAEERLNAIAQVIAECDGMHTASLRNCLKHSLVYLSLRLC
jgi:hypothetical protein